MTRILAAFAVVLIAMSARAENERAPWLRVDASLYPYQHTLDGDVDFTTTINARVSKRFSYFSFINFKGVVTSGSAVFDRSEQNLRYSMSDRLPLDLSLQGVLARGDGNDFYQAGVSWRVHDTPGWQDFFDRVSVVYRLTLQLRRFETDNNDAWQMEHYFRMTFPQVSDRLYLSGFVDQTFDEDLPDALPRSPIVAEVQFGVRVFDHFYAISEYRVNQKRLGDEHNFAAGIEYKMRW
jgi:hypothetical protein